MDLMKENSFHELVLVIKKVNVEPALFLYMISSFMHFPVFQSLIYQKACLQLYDGDEIYCGNVTAANRDVAVQTLANHVFLFSSLCLLLPSMPTTVMLGTFGDLVSRKISLLLPLVGLVLSDLSYLIQCHFKHLDVYILLISDLLFGIFGGFSALIASMFSYGADSTAVVNRSYRMALMEGSIGLGGMIGFLVSGPLLESAGFSAVFLVNIVIHTVVFAYVLLFVRELPPRHSSLCSAANISRHAHFFSTVVAFFRLVETYLQQTCSTVVKTRHTHVRRCIVVVLMAFSVSYLVFSGAYPFV
ncbi:unnamed protein product [Soboliphyme baturini]|uniref:MFS domain-containing protein n=1 Tax=Soboliphyme baturini TaxID=241478 RepID=A0A183ILI4_9BILA|nr:unnamed protein product [Soboliphyme baturini]